MELGGGGSGRHRHFGAKDTTDDYRTLDVRRWQREGYLEPGHRFGWQWTRDSETVASIQVRAEPDRVILSYQHRSDVGEWKRERSILLASTERPAPTAARGPGSAARLEDAGDGWRSCTVGGAIFACRHCYRLAYPSQQEPPHERAARRADKIWARLGWEPGILNDPGWRKPKGMHWRTYERLSTEAAEWTAVSLAKMMRRFGVGPEEW